MTEVKKTKLIPPYLVASSMLAMFILDRYLPLYEWRHTQWLGFSFMLLAFLCIVYCAYLFHKNHTEIKPLEESSFLILSWPYTISRNPIYLCMIIFLVGWCLWLQSISSLLIVIIFSAWIHYRFVLQEETMLEKTFGQFYLTYKSYTRRWL